MTQFPKKLAACAVTIAAISSPNVAFSASSATDLTHCKTMSEIASAVMGARQAGVRMSAAMESASKADDYWATISSTLIEEAYKEPIRSDETEKVAIAEEFEDTIYASCLRTRNKN